MKVSVVLASYNGAATLPTTLRALSSLVCEDYELEFILVDNASTDDTASLLKAFAARDGARYVLELQPGRSNALNAGARVASGDLLVFTDDDVIPDPGWISAYVRAAREQPSTVAFAGQIRLHWPKPPRRWLAELERLGRTLGATPLDRGLGRISATEVKGANSAVRSAMFTAVGGFRRDLGVSSSGPALAGEETAFFGALEKLGHGVTFVPAARLLHIVRPHQMGLGSLMQRGFRNGRGAASIDPEPLPYSRLRIGGLPGYCTANLTKVMLSAASRFLRRDSTGAVCELLRASEMAGFYWGKSSARGAGLKDKRS